MSVTEPDLVAHWLHDILTQDSVLNDTSTGVLGGWHEIAPAGVRSPYAIVRMLTAAEDFVGLAEATLIWVPIVMQVIVYERIRGDYTRLAPLAARVYALLQAQDGETAEGIVFGCHRTLVRRATDTIGDAVERSIEQQFTIEARSL